jgi:Cu/Ag efflux protein CusF
MKQKIIATLAIALTMPVAAIAVEAQQLPATARTASATSMSDGEVRKVDPETKKITLRHGPIQNLGMPPMTMVFQVKDPAMLDQVKAGDKVKFNADKVNGAYIVTRIEGVQ